MEMSCWTIDWSVLWRTNLCEYPQRDQQSQGELESRVHWLQALVTARPSGHLRQQKAEESRGGYPSKQFEVYPAGRLLA
jgi:hypothetical protein